MCKGWVGKKIFKVQGGLCKNISNLSHPLQYIFGGKIAEMGQNGSFQSWTDFYLKPCISRNYLEQGDSALLLISVFNFSLVKQSIKGDGKFELYFTYFCLFYLVFFFHCFLLLFCFYSLNRVYSFCYFCSFVF